MGTLLLTLIIGVGATALMDAWSLTRKALLGLPAPDFALVGRWIGHMRRGRFRHERIAEARPIAGERTLGWAAHYLIGIAFAAGLVLLGGPAWLAHPTPGLALVVGIATVAAPFLLMQPGMGAGLAARRTPRPWLARRQSLLNHAVFGLGLYASAWLATGLSG
ncbi:MAG: hypothetical protein CL543_02205 [Alcanivorax sp.]|nr:hypothetical protein [Alcanivorax sp.]